MNRGLKTVLLIVVAVAALGLGAKHLEPYQACESGTLGFGLGETCTLPGPLLIMLLAFVAVCVLVAGLALSLVQPRDRRLTPLVRYDATGPSRDEAS